MTLQLFRFLPLTSSDGICSFWHTSEAHFAISSSGSMSFPVSSATSVLLGQCYTLFFLYIDISLLLFLGLVHFQSFRKGGFLSVVFILSQNKKCCSLC